MVAKFKLRTVLIFLVITVGLASLIWMRHQEYRLNRTVRTIALRVVQLETLSRTTRVDYRMVFWNNRCVIDRFDRRTQKWSWYQNTPYARKVFSQPSGYELIFSEGQLQEYSAPGSKSITKRNLIVEFFIPGTPLKHAMIFYADGNWRVLN